MAEGGAAGATGAGVLEGVLEDLRALSGEVTTAAVLLKDGELEAATLPPGVDRERYAAMLAALAGIARRSAREKGGSSFSQVRIKGEGGHVLLVGLDARVGLVLYDMRNTRKEVEKMIGFGEGGQG